ncbi:hypothetical protein GIB67_023253 [Kingdonia uniflora]|uniref:Retrotransposon Copia-like N-terminal domain-containing protein n=1 Tax=Kingdonia uniflora TaxID=39325 RepID=A0A7J7LJC1_9MAGN|nr:hypothetical protein GIB67_023253 [Kingdonia uniflora]
MAIDDESSSSLSLTISSIGTSEDVHSFNFVHDNPNLKITSQLLDGLNYVRWARSVKLFVGGRGKIGFLLGTEKEPAKSNPKYAKWFSYDSMRPASAPSEKVPTLPTIAEIYAKIVEKTWVFQFLAGLNPDFEYARVHLLNITPFPTLKEANTYCLSDQSRRLPMPLISGIPSETSAMTVRYAYPVPPSVPSQTSQTSSPSLSSLPAASGFLHLA